MAAAVREPVPASEARSVPCRSTAGSWDTSPASGSRRPLAGSVSLLC